MGRGTFSRDAFVGATDQFTTRGKSATHRGEEEVRATGKLNPLVDPAEFGVIRESRMRFEEKGDQFEVTVGTPVPIEYRLDTTGSMGDNVDRALVVLPEICELSTGALPGRDPFWCASIFGDLEDRFGGGSPGFPLCRGQYEAEAEKMVNQLTLMHPMRQGCGNGGEDPHYGLFGSAYLTKAYLRRAGLRSYDFTVTDEPMHRGFDAQQLRRIYGPHVFDKLKDNGFEFSPGELPENEDMVRDLLKQAHAFVLLVEGRGIRSHWEDFFGAERVISLPSVEVSPHIMATVIGLTEGTFDLKSAIDFLTDFKVEKSSARSIVDAVAHIPLGAQRALPNFSRLPVKGDIFASKTDLWPVGAAEPKKAGSKKPGKPKPATDNGGWL